MRRRSKGLSSLAIALFGLAIVTAVAFAEGYAAEAAKGSDAAKAAVVTAPAAGPSAPFSAARLDAWKIIGPGGGGAQYYPTVSPLDPNKVLVRCDMTGAYLSEDGGNSWRMFNGRDTASFFVFDPVDTNVIYCGRLGLLRSADGGKTWNLIYPDPAKVKKVTQSADHAEESIVTTDALSENVTALAVDPADSKTLYAAIASAEWARLMVSTDWGKTWTKSAELPSDGGAIYVDPKSPKGDRTVYVISGASVGVREGGKWTQHPGPAGVASFASVSAGFASGGGKPIIYGATGWGRRGATAAPGIFKSADGGATWQRTDAGLAAKSSPGARPAIPLAIATCLTKPLVAYVSYSDLITGAGDANTFFGVAKTADGGKTWNLVWKESDKAAPNIHDGWLSETFGPGWGDAPRYLGVAPTNPDICYGTDDGRTMRTTDGGKTWAGVYSKKTPAGKWSTTGLDVTTCYGVHFDPFDAKRIFISYTDINLFMSEDGGSSWISAARGVPHEWINTCYWMVFDPEVKGRAWAAMSSVHDLPRPKMWRQDGLPLRGGVCMSTDGGRSWAPSNTGMPETDVTHIILDPKSPADARVLYAAGFGTGVFKSTDGGKTWTLMNKGLPAVEPFAWRLSRDSKGTLYVILARRTEEGETGPGDGELYRSTDGAATWEKVNLPSGCNGPNGLAIDPADDNTLYLAAWGRVVPDGAAGGGIFASSDAGKTWKSVLSNDQFIYDVTIDAKNSDILYASGFDSSVWRSADKGKTWNRLKGFNFKWGHRVIVDPLHEDKIFVTTFGGSVWYGPATGDPSATEDIVTPVMKW